MTDEGLVATREQEALALIERVRARPPRFRESQITMAHGAGGKASATLIEGLFVPAFGSISLNQLGDAGTVTIDGLGLALTTDSFVVKPIRFPGGSIGELAVNGTVNDLAMSGATPLVMSTAFILAEGTALSDLGRIAEALGAAARVAGVTLVTGDTKVVDSGSGDGVFINTAGIGVLADGIDIRPDRASPGDVVLVSGDIGVHGVAVMSCREGLEFGTTIESDSAPLHGLVADIIAVNRKLLEDVQQRLRQIEYQRAK